MENLELIIVLLTAITFLAVFSERFKLPFPIILVLLGLALSLIPGLPVIILKPDIVFLIFLPPLLYQAAWQTSWHDFKVNSRPIALAGIGLVFFTTLTVGWAAHTFATGLSWTEAFLLGAIVSPPDAVAASSITKGLGLHKRIITIIEGESLINDASGLVAYRFALAALITGTFSWWEAGLSFIWVASAGIIIGLLVGYLIEQVHKHLKMTPTVEIPLTFWTAYASYLIAEHLHVSGVLAVVTTGLYLSYRSSEFFKHKNRIQAFAVWETIGFVLNGIVFILIGLQLRYVLSEIDQHPLSELIIEGLIISLVVIAGRFIWIYSGAYIPRLFKKVSEDENFTHSEVLILSWTGLRGVVSMAIALSLPITLNQNIPFHNRSLLIFFTFCVIMVTLMIQGLSLPSLIKFLKIKPYSIVQDEHKVRTRLVSTIVEYIESNLSAGEISEQILAQIKTKYEIKQNKLNFTDISGLGARPSPDEVFNQFNTIQTDLINIERKMLNEMRKSGKADNEVFRKIENELDLEEARLSLEKYDD